MSSIPYRCFVCGDCREENAAKECENAERIAELEAELEWYHTLKIVRSDDSVTRIDGGETAQLLHEMWEENLHLKAELEKRPGLSQEETEDILGGKMMNTVQQGAELLSRGKKIDTLKGRIAELEAEVLLWKSRLLGALEVLPANTTCGELRQYADDVSHLRERAEKAEAELAESDKVLGKTLWSMRCILSEYEHEIDDLTRDMATASIIFKAEEQRADILKAEQDKLRELLQEFTNIIERRDSSLLYSECYGKKTYGWGDRRNLIAMLYRKAREALDD